jgi:hypothetical protein
MSSARPGASEGSSPNLLGGLKGVTGSYGTGFAVFAATGAACVALMPALRVRWESTFLSALNEPRAAEPATAEPLVAPATN